MHYITRNSGFIATQKVFLVFFSCKLTVVKHTSVGQQQCDQFGVLVQLHGVLALVGKQSANVNSEIHFVG